MPEQGNALVVTSLSKNFGGVQAVQSVDLVVRAGERRALIGPNGAGKSTLFNLITGELKPDAGKIEVFNTDVTSRSVRQRAGLGLGRTYQISELFLGLTVEENLFLGAAANRGMEFNLFGAWRNRTVDRDWVSRVAEQVHLFEYLDEKVSELSHGLQRQLELGVALAMRPRLIMLDEPAAGLTPLERRILTSLIKALPREATLILIEHDMDIILDIAECITVLNRGAVLTEGTPAEIRSNRDVQEVYLGMAYAS